MTIGSMIGEIGAEVNREVTLVMARLGDGLAGGALPGACLAAIKP